MATQRAPIDDEAEQASIEENIKSILEIPYDQCPWPPVRRALLKWALNGADVYAYRPAFQTAYVIWHRQADPAIDARFTPQRWAERYGFEIVSDTCREVQHADTSR